MPPPGNRSSWDEKLTRSGLFLAALLFHLVIFLIVAGCIIFNAPPAQPDATFKGFTPQQARETVQTPTRDNVNDAPKVDVSVNTSPDVNVVSTTSRSPMHLPPVPMGGELTGTIIDPAPPADPGLAIEQKKIRLQKIRDFILTYQTLENIQNGILKAKFPVYVASYADGDWACNSRLDTEGRIVGGSMPDLAAKIDEWSHGDVEAQVMPEPLKIGGTDLTDKKPPFIFFTGHKDFVLTDQEIANLQAYLAEGGLIWGDNALPGKGSRFDVAFRREMGRVVGDKNEFEPMSLDADIFTKSKFQIATLPPGMNYYSEPLEHIDLDGKLAILYTPNDYSDLFYLRILPGDTVIGPTANDRKWTSPLLTSGTFWGNSTTFFRNFTLPSALAVHRLGMNIVVHLLTRFNDEVQLTP
jgi:hypothetical protein